MWCYICVKLAVLGMQWRFSPLEFWNTRFMQPCHCLASRHGRGISPSTSVFSCQYHSTIAPYSFIHLTPTLYNVFIPVLQFSPVSIIPPLLHTHPSIYHPHCVMFFSQHFSFPPFSTIPPLLHTHPSIYHPRCIMFLSQYSSVFPCQ